MVFHRQTVTIKQFVLSQYIEYGFNRIGTPLLFNIYRAE